MKKNLLYLSLALLTTTVACKKNSDTPAQKMISSVIFASANSTDSIAYVYNTDGTLLADEYFEGSYQSANFYQYNSGKLTMVTSSDGNTDINRTSDTTDIVYDNGGKIVKVIKRNQGIYDTLVYNPQGNPVKVYTVNPGQLNNSRVDSLVWDAKGNVTAVYSQSLFATDQYVDNYTYDNSPTPYASINGQARLVYYLINSFPQAISASNLTKETESSAAYGISYSSSYSYVYGSDGFPLNAGITGSDVGTLRYNYIQR
ncbi:hypothetical protein [Deminuibacter soli]|uniref:DUF4595 domain-containing protein n=1 Tax=Deminuibacter soli TaxID=2291815 RepID=A0A3E1NR91_9BACT|nr:hypothetical protein [Deminuibacter soli]RFM30298.1 hypothetical protein DXN05_04865 [Deminuibacter soli]